MASPEQKAEYNRLAQARWRERHAMKRFAAQQISNAILRRQWTDETIAELASALTSVLNSAGIVALRRALKPKTPEKIAALQKETFRQEQALLLREHPRQTPQDFWRVSLVELGTWAQAKTETTPQGP